MAKKRALPTVNDKGFFQLLDFLEFNGKRYAPGSWFKRLSESKTGASWVIRPKFWKDSAAKRVKVVFLKG